MLNGIGVFDLSSARLSYETAGLKVVSQNIANADTPGFRGRIVVPFAETLRRLGRGDDQSVQTEAAPVLEEAPNGNTVSLEDEIMQSARLRAGHALAATTFEKNLELMRLAITS